MILWTILNIFAASGIDPRQPVDRSSPEARSLLPIGIVSNAEPIKLESGAKEVTVATGFMVSPCFMLTNRHALFGSNANPGKGSSWSLVIQIGPSPGGQFRYRLRGNPIRWGQDATVDEDWALIQLEKCAGRGLGWLPLEIIDWQHAKNVDVSMAGYPADKLSTSIWVQKKCRIVDFNNGINAFDHDCAARPGASGSPIFKLRDGIPYVVAFHAGAPTDRPEILRSYSRVDANGAVPLNFLNSNPDVPALIKLDIASFAGPNPALP